LLLPFTAKGITEPASIIRVCPDNTQNNTVFWNVPSDACGSFTGYYIYSRTYPSGSFQLIDSVKNYGTNQYVHTGASQNREYFIITKYLCDLSEGSSDTVKVTQDPIQPVIDSVSVNIYTNEIIIGWKRPPGKDIMGYQVDKYETTNVNFAFTTNTYFIQSPSNDNPRTKSFGYSIATVDSCFLESAISLTHRTIFLQAAFDTCQKTTSLSWTRYDPGSNDLGVVGWGVSKYEVYMAVNFGSYQKVGEVDGTTTTYTHYGYTPGDSISFYVRAHKLSSVPATSSSNTVGYRSRARRIPAFCYVRCADVLDDGNVKITWHPDLNGEIDYFKVFYSFNGIKYFEIDKINNDINQEKSYTHTSSASSRGPVFYKVVCFDICDSVILSSNTVRTSYVTSIAVGTESILANWTNYLGFEKGVKIYEVQRGVDLGSGIIWNPVSKEGDTLFLDENPPNEVGEKGICYRLTAHEEGPDAFGFSDSCHSNVSCAQQPIIAFFPSAFVPTGLNTEFRPVCSFVDFNVSFMIIYNRWGQEVGRVDLKSGWNGMKDGKLLPEGMYFFVANLYSSLNGTSKVYAGHVLLFNSE
jgi:hypothetical protein